MENRFRMAYCIAIVALGILVLSYISIQVIPSYCDSEQELEFKIFEEEPRELIGIPAQEGRLGINPIPGPYGVFFEIDYVVFTDGVLTLDTRDIFFDFEKLDFMEWDINGTTYTFDKTRIERNDLNHTFVVTRTERKWWIVEGNLTVFNDDDLETLIINKTEELHLQDRSKLVRMHGCSPERCLTFEATPDDFKAGKWIND